MRNIITISYPRQQNKCFDKNHFIVIISPSSRFFFIQKSTDVSMDVGIEGKEKNHFGGCYHTLL